MTKGPERFLHENTRGWWRYERSIPTDLRAAFGGLAKWRKSLGTDSRKEALRQKRELDALTEQLFSDARKALATQTAFAAHGPVIRQTLSEMLPDLAIGDELVSTLEGLKVLKAVNRHADRSLIGAVSL
ncbi:MAG: hypothetical protein PW843_27465 [Azospirillaceae bacterium]|nr:hypothetical protein [Azospirillaceae bacterium]